MKHQPARRRNSEASLYKTCVTDNDIVTWARMMLTPRCCEPPLDTPDQWHDTHVQLWSANVTKSTKKLYKRMPCYLAAPVCTPHALITPQHGLMIHCDVQIVIGRRKTPDYAQHFFLQPIYWKVMAWILSFMPALVEPLAKIFSLVLMKATFVKHVPSTLHLQWFLRPPSMQTNFCLRINLGTCTNLWLFEWKKVKSLRVFVCESRAGAQ